MLRIITLCTFIMLLFAWSMPLQAQDGVTLSNTEICQGDSVNLSYLINGSLQVFHSWSINGKLLTNSNINYIDHPTSTTVYTLDYESGGQRGQKTLTVTVYQTPNFTIPKNHSICSGNSVELYANVHNSIPTTSIMWTSNDGYIYNNNAVIRPTSTALTYTYTATVHNHSMCPGESQSFSVTVNLNPANIMIGVANPNSWQCQGVAFNLDSLVAFYARDNYGNSARSNVQSGDITWYASPNTPTPISSSTIRINTSRDTIFWADYNGIEACYTNECTGSSSYCRTFTGQSRWPVPIRMSKSSFSIADDQPCRGEPVNAIYQLMDIHTNELSTCDAIQSFEIVLGARKHTINKINKTQWSVQFDPLTGAEDSIMVRLVSASGTDTTYTHKLTHREPAPQGSHPSSPYFLPEAIPVCKGQDVTFYIVGNKCDDIKDVKFTGLEKYTVQKKKERKDLYEIKVERLLDDTLRFSYEINYWSDYNEIDSVITGNYTLTLLKIAPQTEIRVNNTSFSANPHLCLGDSLTYNFYPGACDSLTSSTMTGAKQISISPYQHKYVVKPTSSGTYNMTATITYRRSTDTGDSTFIVNFTINVVPRPYLFINNQSTDTTGFCDENEVIDLRSPNGRINDLYVEPNSAFFSTFGPSSYSIQPINPNAYNVSATYKYFCSEMYSPKADGLLYIMLDTRNIGNMIPEFSDFCVTHGVNIFTTPLGSTKLIWKHDENIISFPYMIDPGDYTLTLVATNSCLPSGVITPMPITVVAEPVVETMPDTAVCYNSIIPLEVQPNAIGNLSWSAPSPATITQTASFMVTASNVCGSVYDNVEISLIPDVGVQIAGDTSVCYGDSILLTTISHEGALIWSDRYGLLYGDPPKVQIKADEVFKVTAENKCGDTVAFFNVASIALPFVEVANDSAVCYGDSFIPQVRRSVGALVWKPDKADNVTEPVTFVVTATMEKCGSYQDTLNLGIYPSLELHPVSLPTYKRQKQYAVQFKILNSDPPMQYTISGSLPAGMMITPDGIAGTPIMGPHDYNTYPVHVYAIDGHNCEVEKAYTLIPEWSAATAFMPAEGNENSIFLPGFQVEIYTRNGILIFKGTDGWNGRSDGSLVSAGTYFYKATAVFDGIVKQYTGYTTVMYR